MLTILVHATALHCMLRASGIPSDCDSTSTIILNEFLEKIDSGSPAYKKIFVRFYSCRHNNSEAAITNFVGEVEWQMRTPTVVWVARAKKRASPMFKAYCS